MGLIQTTADSFCLPAALPLQEGTLLFNVRIAFEIYGSLDARETVVLLHDFTQSHHALSRPPHTYYQPSGWGNELLGDDKPISMHSVRVVSINLLGSPFGSMSPLSLDPRTKRPLGVEFPEISVEDMARSVAGLLRGLGLEEVRSVIGIGLGGMVALRLASLFPAVTRSVIALGVARALPEGIRQHLTAMAQRLRPSADISETTNPGRTGAPVLLEDARMEFSWRLYSRLNLSALFADAEMAERILAAEADEFGKAFNRTSYIRLSDAYAAFDLKPFYERIRCKVLLVTNSSNELASASRVRETYHALTAAGVQAHVYELQSDGGHPALLAEAARLRGPISEFLSSVRSRASRAETPVP